MAPPEAGHDDCPIGPSKVCMCGAVERSCAGSTFWTKPHSRLHECFRWSLVLVRSSRSAARCRGSSGHWATLLAPVAYCFQPSRIFYPYPDHPRGFQQGLMSQQQWPLWPEGKRAEQRPSERPSRCTYFQRSPDCKAGGQLLWELNQGASCPPRSQAH